MPIYPEINPTKFYPAKDNNNILGRFFDRRRGEDKDGKEVIATYCEIEIMGDKYTKPCNIISVDSPEIKRFPEAWQEFKTGKAQELEGTSLLDLKTENEGINLMLWRKGYTTIESLVKCDEDSIASLGIGYRQVHREAVAWLKEHREKVVDTVAEKTQVAEYQAEPAKETKVCVKCGKEFKPSVKSQKYCSKECSGRK